MKKSALSIALAAGLASTAMAANDGFELTHEAKYMPMSAMNSVAHIYVNIATGEKIISRVNAGQTSAVDTGASELVWDCDLNIHQCEGINGFTGGTGFVGLDDPAGTSPNDLNYDVTWASMGDVPLDTLVDCVRFTYTTNILDVDTDSNGVGDGVPGFGMIVDYWDADNGLGNVSTRLPLLQIQIDDLAGNEDVVENGEWVGFIFTLDLAADLTADARFEIGDSDGDLQGAPIGNNDVDTNSDGVGDGVSIGAPGLDRDLDGNDDADIDGDGLFDYAMNMHFLQPGEYDLDGDGTIDGDIAAQGETGTFLGAPAGYNPVDDGTGVWAWDIDLGAPAVATGTRSFTGIYNRPDANGDILWSGFVSNFGFTDGVPNPVGCTEGAFNPTLTFDKALFTPGEVVCAADVNNDGLLDFFDVSDFLEAFALGDDYNGDGLADFFDVADFLDDFAAGCPAG